MTELHAWRCTDDLFIASSKVPEPVRIAMCTWIRFHDGDPDRIPLSTPIRRDVDHCAVIVQYVRLDDDGHMIRNGSEVVTDEVILQGETPPAPFPDLVRRVRASR